ncbi:MAG: penicillin-binding protein 2 [Proteobacteria bacterium]|nr:penicillin-binding protein 2 [Pseudomonadota bacterium]
MSSLHHIKDEHAEKSLFRSRAKIAFFLILIALVILAARFTYLQVWKYGSFRAQADKNRIRIQTVAPSRGMIYDRNGILLAENKPAYRLEITTERLVRPRVAGKRISLSQALDSTLDELELLVTITPSQRNRFLRVSRQSKPFQAVPLRLSLNERELSRIAVNRHRLPGVEITPYLNRYYPGGKAMTHLIGYVGRIDESELAGLDRENYQANTHIGKTGVERYREALLHGESGFEKVETNAQGRVLRVLEREDPRAGQDLMLAVDVRLQLAAWEAMSEYSGSIVAIDPNNGDVLAMVSKPGFDANLFVNGITQSDYSRILNAPDRPLYNRALKGGYEPGSTFKPFVALAGLESGTINVETRVFSSGEFYLPNVSRPYRDWRPGGHGWVTARSALQKSVNTYFYELGVKLGIDNMHDYIQQFGFGQPTGIDLYGEGVGILPSRGWKRARFNQPWYPGETVIAAIGQGYNVVTPLQLASATATLAMNGKRYIPRLVRGLKKYGHKDVDWLSPTEGVPVPVVNPLNWAEVRGGMEDVVNSSTGTARKIGKGATYRIAGKSGTAQVFGLAKGQKYDASTIDRRLRNNALFVAWAPVEAPKIVVAIIIEHAMGGGSSTAAPIALILLDKWLIEAGHLEDETISSQIQDQQVMR